MSLGMRCRMAPMDTRSSRPTRPSGPPIACAMPTTPAAANLSVPMPTPCPSRTFSNTLTPTPCASPPASAAHASHSTMEIASCHGCAGPTTSAAGTAFASAAVGSITPLTSTAASLLLCRRSTRNHGRQTAICRCPATPHAALPLATLPLPPPSHLSSCVYTSPSLRRRCSAVVHPLHPGSSPASLASLCGLRVGPSTRRRRWRTGCGGDRLPPLHLPRLLAPHRRPP